MGTNNMNKKLIQNAIITPDGTFLRSYHGHDFVLYKDANGKEYMVDGGNEYIRRSAHGDEIVKDVYYEDVDHSERRRVMCWGTRGKDGDKPLQWKSIAEMSDDHIKNVLEIPRIPVHYRETFQEELKYRKQNGIQIRD